MGGYIDELIGELIRVDRLVRDNEEGKTVGNYHEPDGQSSQYFRQA